MMSIIDCLLMSNRNMKRVDSMDIMGLFALILAA